MQMHPLHAPQGKSGEDDVVIDRRAPRLKRRHQQMMHANARYIDRVGLGREQRLRRSAQGQLKPHSAQRVAVDVRRRRACLKAAYSSQGHRDLRPVIVGHDKVLTDQRVKYIWGKFIHGADYAKAVIKAQAGMRALAKWTILQIAGHPRCSSSLQSVIVAVKNMQFKVEKILPNRYDNAI